MRILRSRGFSADQKLSATIVVPCFNEEARLDSKTFERFASAHPEVHFILVNDGSVDGTANQLRELEKRSPHSFTTIDLKINQGKAQATRIGLLRALQMSSDYVGYWDADLATPLDAIPLFCSVLDRHEKTQAVIGTRLSLLGRQITRNPIRARLGWLFARVASLVLGFKILDTQCGAKLFRASDELVVALEQPFSSAWIFDVEFLIRLKALFGEGFPKRVYEFPLEVWNEIEGSKLKPKHFFLAARQLISISLRYRGSQLDKYQAFVRARLQETASHPNRTGSQLEPIQSKAA